MAQKIIQMQMRHLYFNLKDLFSNRKGFVILTSLLRFKNKSREFREYVVFLPTFNQTVSAPIKYQADFISVSTPSAPWPKGGLTFTFLI